MKLNKRGRGAIILSLTIETIAIIAEIAEKKHVSKSYAAEILIERGYNWEEKKEARIKRQEQCNQELTAQDLRRQWDEAYQKAKADPEGTRVIVETNEREEETGDGDRYFMIDKSDGCGNEYDRWQVIRCDCAASPYDTRTAKAYTVGTEAQPSCEVSNPNNVTRWAERMINAGRVVSIYADCY